MKRKLSQQHLFFIHFSYSHLLVLLLHHYHIQAQPNITGYPCSPTQSTSPCQTYAFYRAKPPDPLDRAPQPDLLDLSTIADLFGVSRLMITKASNISSPTSPLLPNQSLLVPITCSCNSNYNMSFSNLTYTIKQFDTFYRVSTGQFLNLTTYQAVELVNPSLVPTNLDIGIDVFFPIFCKCPNSTQLMNNVTYLISYVFQPSDNLSAIAAMFGSDLQSLTSLNEKNIHPFDTVFVPVSRIPQLKQPPAVPLSPPPLSPPRRTERQEVIIGLSVGLAITGFLLILLIAGIGIWFYRESLKRSGRRRGEEEKKYRLGRMKSSIEEENLMADVSECLDKYRVFGIQAVREATNDFDPSCLIQGSVYKGCMNGEFYAIKRMKWNACEELKILQKVNHGNLVKLEGFCIDREEGNCYLVYEYVENGSLHQWLHGDRANKKKLDWKTRLRIAIDVANGLQYIHEHTRPKVVHKDIKSSNILLDGNMRAKIANFGLAKSGCNAITMHIVGTQGYIAPEYLADGIVTTKMDVFAFGVVLLELISGKEAINEEGKVIWMTVDRILEDREDKKYQKLTEWMDEALVEESCSIESVMNVMAVAVACIQKDASSRPNMVDIVYTLCKSDDLYFDFSQDGLSVTPLSAR